MYVCICVRVHIYVDRIRSIKHTVRLTIFLDAEENCIFTKV